MKRWTGLSSTAAPAVSSNDRRPLARRALSGFLPAASLFAALPAAAQVPCQGVCIGFGAGVAGVPALSPAATLLVSLLLAWAGYAFLRRRSGLAAMVMAAALGFAAITADVRQAIAVAAYQVVLAAGSFASVVLPPGYSGPVDVQNPQPYPVTITSITVAPGFSLGAGTTLHAGSVIPAGATVAAGILVEVAAPPANHPPTANDFTYGTGIGSAAKTFNWKTGSGATDADGDALSASVKTQGAKGTVSVSGDNVTYTPSAGQTGSDTFVLTVSDGNGGTKDITVTVNGINFTPTVSGVPASATNGKNTSYAFGISVAVGTATVTASSDNPTLVNAVTVTGTGTNRTVTVSPVTGQVGTANIAVTATSTVDGNALTDSKVLALTFANDAPVANNFAYATVIGAAGGTFNWKTGSGATDANGDALSATVSSAPANGTVSSVVGDSVTYVPNPGFNGTETFTLAVSDGTASVPVVVTVAADTAAPAVENVVMDGGAITPWYYGIGFMNNNFKVSDAGGGDVTVTLSAPMMGGAYAYFTNADGSSGGGSVLSSITVPSGTTVYWAYASDPLASPGPDIITATVTDARGNTDPSPTTVGAYAYQ